MNRETYDNTQFQIEMRFSLKEAEAKGYMESKRLNISRHQQKSPAISKPEFAIIPT